MRQLNIIALVALICASLAACGSTRRAVITLQDGDVVSGEVIREEPDALYLKQRDASWTRRVDRQDVHRYEPVETRRNGGVTAGAIVMGVGATVAVTALAVPCDGMGCLPNAVVGVTGLSGIGIGGIIAIISAVASSGDEPRTSSLTGEAPPPAIRATANGVAFSF